MVNSHDEYPGDDVSRKFIERADFPLPGEATTINMLITEELYGFFYDLNRAKLRKKDWEMGYDLYCVTKI
jgi:hypothetical protein